MKSSSTRSSIFVSYQIFCFFCNGAEAEKPSLASSAHHLGNECRLSSSIANFLLFSFTGWILRLVGQLGLQIPSSGRCPNGLLMVRSSSGPGGCTPTVCTNTVSLKICCGQLPVSIEGRGVMVSRWNRIHLKHSFNGMDVCWNWGAIKKESESLDRFSILKPMVLIIGITMDRPFYETPHLRTIGWIEAQLVNPPCRMSRPEEVPQHWPGPHRPAPSGKNHSVSTTGNDMGIPGTFLWRDCNVGKTMPSPIWEW